MHFLGSEVPAGLWPRPLGCLLIYETAAPRLQGQDGALPEGTLLRALASQLLLRRPLVSCTNLCQEDW